jgi:serine/threonine protein kinase
MSAAAFRSAVDFLDPEEFRSVWNSIVHAGTCFVPGVEHPPGTQLKVAFNAPGLGPIEIAGEVVATQVDPSGRRGSTVFLELEDVARARFLIEAAQHSASGTPAAVPSPPSVPADPESADRLESGTLLDGRFQIESHLASGGMGEVYRAAHVYLKRPVALKLLKRALSSDPEMWVRFEREAQLVSQLESPHIVRIFDFGKTQDGQPFLAMEFVEGTTLDNLLARDGAMRPEHAVQMVLQISQGLEEAHANGVVHRDLKPSNIIVGSKRDGTPQAKILDFGIARFADSKKSGSVTGRGMVVGTPAYLPPEQALADTLDARTDIYALGCVAYELLTGRPPFVYPELAKLVSAHLNEKPASPERFRPELAEFPALCRGVLKAMEKDRADRFQSVGELMRAFSSAVGPEARVAPALSAAPAVPSELPPPQAFTHGLIATFGGPAPVPPSSGEEELPTGTVLTDSQVLRFDSLEVPAGEPRRLEAELEKAGVQLEPMREIDLLARREGLVAGAHKGVALIVEMHAPSGANALASRGLTQLVSLGVAHGGILDHCGPSGVVLFFRGDEHWATGGRAVLAAHSMREALELERSGAGTNPAISLRAAVAAGQVEIPAGDRPMAGDLLARLGKTLAQAQPGQVLIESALARELEDLTETRDVPGLGLGIYEVAERKPVLPRSKPRLVGREGVVAELDQRLAALARGTSSSLVVIGGSGSGKSAIADGLAARARAQSMLVGMSRGSRAMRDIPYSALAELLCAFTGVPWHQRLTGLRPALEKLSLQPAELEGALVVAGVRQLPRPVTPGQAVNTLRTVVTAAAAGRKSLLIFDEPQLLDRFSVDAFFELAINPRPGLLTIGFSDPLWARERLPGVPTLSLGSLTQAEVEAWLPQILANGKVSKEVSDLVFSRSGGTPGLALDWLHLLCDLGMLRLRKGAWALSGEPPILSAEELVHARLNALGAQARRVLEAICIAEGTLDAQQLAALVPEVSRPGFQRLTASGLLRMAGEARWSVASDRFLAAAMSENPAGRSELHQRFATQLVEFARVAGIHPDAALVAGHLTLAGDGARAVPIWRHAVELALARRATRETLVAFKGWADAIGTVPGANERPAIVRERLDALARAAGNALACDDAVLARALVDDALAIARATSQLTAELQLMVARVLRSEARRGKAAEALAEAQALARGTPVEGLCCFELGEVRESEGDTEGAVAAYKAALGWASASAELARGYGEVDFQASIEVRLASLAAATDPATANRLLNSARGRLSAAQAPYQEARVLASLGAVALATREVNDAVRRFEDACNVAARAGDALFQARQTIALAKVLERGEQFEMAAKRAESARRLAEAICWAEGKREAQGLADQLRARARR